MRRLILRFALMALVLLTASRLGLGLWQAERVADGGGLAAVMLGGLRIDISLIAMLIAIPALLAPWLGHRTWPTRFCAAFFLVLWLVLVLLEASTPGWIQEYDTRPNRLFVEYLVSPREVGGMLLRGYTGVVIATIVAIGLAFWFGRRLLAPTPPDRRWPLVRRILVTVVVLPLIVLAARGTLQHRPINPSTVAVGNDAMVNALPLSGFYNVARAIHDSRRERSSHDVYGGMAEADMQQRVRATLGLAGTVFDPRWPTLRQQPPIQARARPLDIVIIVEESLGAQFVGHLGGRNLTPNLDRWSEQAWTFGRLYATGTRSARGLEALTTGFLPTPAEAVLKLPRSQRDFLTLASLLAPHGYRSRFIYGGEAHFDNMKGFFLGNGFDEVVDRDRFAEARFVGTWGASDDDMFAELDRRLEADARARAAADPVDGRPTLTVAFTVSNHTPWEFPADRIAVDGEADHDDAIRYADKALGDYLDRASRKPYWQDVVVLVAADHDARAGGASLVPVHNFHIPALILGAGISPRRDDRLVSQIDLPVTLMSLAGIDVAHPIPGVDLSRQSPDRAVMQYGDAHGYLWSGASAGDQIVVHEPNQPGRQFGVEGGLGGRPVKLTQAAADPERVATGLALALWPDWAYRGGHYRVPGPDVKPGPAAAPAAVAVPAAVVPAAVVPAAVVAPAAAAASAADQAEGKSR